MSINWCPGPCVQSVSPGNTAESVGLQVITKAFITRGLEAQSEVLTADPHQGLNVANMYFCGLSALELPQCQPVLGYYQWNVSALLLSGRPDCWVAEK